MSTPQFMAISLPVLMIVANAVAAAITGSDRLVGRTAAKDVS
jgi:hypothetical protein